MNEKTQNVMFSTGNDEYETPSSLFDPINTIFNFTLDPCASDVSHKTKKYFTKVDNGLEKTWKGERVFVNLPYSQTRKWMAKCARESKHSEIVVLCPARTDTRAFQDFVFPVARGITFIRGRITFISRVSPLYIACKNTIEDFGEVDDILSIYENMAKKPLSKAPQKNNLDIAKNEYHIQRYDIGSCTEKLVRTITSPAPFPSALIYYCSNREGEIKRAKEVVDGYTILL